MKKKKLGETIPYIIVIAQNIGANREVMNAAKHEGGSKDQTPLLDITLLADRENPTILTLGETHWHKGCEPLQLAFLEEEGFNAKSKKGGRTTESQGITHYHGGTCIIIKRKWELPPGQEEGPEDRGVRSRRRAGLDGHR